MSEARKTPFHALQRERGGRFVAFAGFELPVQFTGVMAEHRAVRAQVGLFDVSHMGEVIIEGPEALSAVQWLLTNNAAKLTDGRAQYALMCRGDGGIVDDLIIYRQAEDSYFLCVNGARREVDFQHICREVARFDCRAQDRSDEWAQLALQGPNADALLTELVAMDVSQLSPFSWMDTNVAGIAEVRVARTGYTGERGFELYCRNESAVSLWEALERAGAPHGLALCGLGARDTLRLEMKYPLYGNDIDEEHNPIEAGLGWVVKMKKGDFCGRSALAMVRESGPSRKWVGFQMVERGIPRPKYPIAIAGEEVGVVTSGSHSPSLGIAIGTGYVPVAHSAVGTNLEILIRGKPVAARIVETPFYQRESK